MPEPILIDHEREGAAFDRAHGHQVRRDTEGPYCLACGARPWWALGQRPCGSKGRVIRVQQTEESMAAKSTYTEEQKRAAVERAAEEGVATVAAELGVTATTLYDWRQRFSKASPPKPTRTAPPKGAAPAERAEDEEVADEKPVRSFAQAVARGPAPKRAPAKKASAPKRPSATKTDQDAMDVVEGLGLGLTRSLAVLAIVEAPDGPDGIEHLEEAIEMIERELERRRAA